MPSTSLVSLLRTEFEDGAGWLLFIEPERLITLGKINSKSSLSSTSAAVMPMAHQPHEIMQSKLRIEVMRNDHFIAVICLFLLLLTCLQCAASHKSCRVSFVTTCRKGRARSRRQRMQVVSRSIRRRCRIFEPRCVRLLPF